jgi:hypothetical protein
VFSSQLLLFIALVLNEDTQKAEGILWWTCVSIREASMCQRVPVPVPASKKENDTIVDIIVVLCLSSMFTQ